MTEAKPKVSLVTPSFDQEGLIGATLASVLDQDYPHLEYVVIDGGSSDRSPAIIESYAEKLAYWISEPDDGHYPALNKGFAKTDGEIMGYLNGDDLLLPGSLDLIARLFADFPEVDWITGAYMAIDEVGHPVGVTAPSRWSRWHIITEGEGRSIPQEATFWRRSLWERAGGTMDEGFRLAADYELWARFSRYSAPTTVRAPLACFRHVAGQRSIAQAEDYRAEVLEIRRRELGLDERSSRSARSARRLLALTRIPGLERARPVVDTVLGAPLELLYDSASGAFYRRAHSQRSARLLLAALASTVGRRFPR